MPVRLKKESYRTMLACGTPDAVDRYRQASKASRSPDGPGGKNFGSGRGVRAGGELLTSTGDIVGRWKKYFEDLLNPTDLPSNEEAEAGVSEVDSSITQAKTEVTEVVRKLHEQWQGAGVDEIRPEYLKSLDVVGLSWLTRLFATLHGGWGQCLWCGKLGWWSLFLKRGTGECVFQLQGDHTSQPPREGLRQGTGEENSADSRPPDSGFRRNNAVFVLVVEHWTSSIPSTGCLRVYGSLPNQSTCALWIWRRHSTVSLVVFCGGCSSASMGSGSLC
ncbi:hypothetical protein L3Q82_007341 [Scortum barcoo]|uniref:Uncharacterized protein n=1 Tax=Scortum barcoo TaxID=214431 RepID=A0ACB8WSS3_9TELE|nr:hypothetical protein L3Q82_007341 [Scortum barcoo]